MKNPVCMVWLALLLGVALPAAAADSLAVLELDLNGDLSDVSRNGEWLERRAHMTQLLRDQLQAKGLYAVVDGPRTGQAVAESGAGAPLSACNGCELDIARRLQARYVLTGAVSRVSNLVLAMTLEIKDVEAGRTVFRKGLDFRGDNDQGWARAIRYFVDNLK